MNTRVKNSQLLVCYLSADSKHQNYWFHLFVLLFILRLELIYFFQVYLFESSQAWTHKPYFYYYALWRISVIATPSFCYKHLMSLFIFYVFCVNSAFTAAAIWPECLNFHLYYVNLRLINSVNLITCKLSIIKQCKI